MFLLNNPFEHHPKLGEFPSFLSTQRVTFSEISSQNRGAFLNMFSPRSLALNDWIRLRTFPPGTFQGSLLHVTYDINDQQLTQPSHKTLRDVIPESLKFSHWLSEMKLKLKNILCFKTKVTILWKDKIYTHNKITITSITNAHLQKILFFSPVFVRFCRYFR